MSDSDPEWVVVESTDPEWDDNYEFIPSLSSTSDPDWDDNDNQEFASSKSKPKWMYDVFLSFRGKDTRRNFVSHLYAAFSNAGLNAFLDDEKIRKGHELGPELLQAIEGSQIAIVVFSTQYFRSGWCLDELVKIMECRKTKGQEVLPVFYGVSPSNLRYLSLRDTLGEALIFPNENIDKGTGWQTALSQAVDLAGWDMKNFRSESQVVTEVVDAILEKLDRDYLPITEFPVGLKSRAEELIEFLKWRSKSVCIVGILGMGGSGKTTIAKVVYNKIRREFKDKSFLSNIREVWEKDRGQIDLQEQLLSDILNLTKLKIHNLEWGKAMIKERLCGKRALIVLDDVNKSEQLFRLCGNLKWICPGSVIIVTTRDVRLLNVLKVDYVYKMKEMDENESLELFSWHSFKEARPRKEFIILSREVVTYCGGLPLALEVLGSYLYKRTKHEWKSVLSKLKRIPNDQIQQKLRISFDGLTDHMEKDIFLHICCFFVGMERAYVTHILNGCKLHADIGITILIERSLIKVEKKNKLGMHDLLRDMGREIVRLHSPEEPEKRSRLCDPEEVVDVLTEYTGTKAVEGLTLKLQRNNRVHFNTKAFQKMKRLKLLQLAHVQLNGD